MLGLRRLLVPVAALSLGMAGCSADSMVEDGQEALERHALPQAERQFRRALSREPRHPGALAGLGWTYQLAGERAAAFGAFERCTEVAPKNPECLRGLASVAMTGGQSARARDLLQQAEVLAPDDPRVQSSLALLELSTDKLEEGAERYASLVRRHPDEGEYRLGLAEARLRQGRAQEAIEVAKEGLKLDSTPVRYRALLWQLQARALVRASGGKEDPERCARTAPPVRAWLDAAEAALDQAAATGVALPDLPAVRRQVARRRAVVDEACPVDPGPLPAFDDTEDQDADPTSDEDTPGTDE